MFTRSFRLRLERLDDRNAPSSLTGNDVATTDWMSPPDVTFSPSGARGDGDPRANAKPRIVNFTVTVGTGQWGTFSGKVLDENPAGLTVRITGPQACLQPNGITVTTDANGNFTWGGQLVNGDTGSVYADTTDAEGLAADTAEYYLTV